MTLILFSVLSGHRLKRSASESQSLVIEPDIANARIEFDNGCVVNLLPVGGHFLRICAESFFSERRIYFSWLFKRKGSGRDWKLLEMLVHLISLILDKQLVPIYFDQPKIEESNAIKMEWKLFAQSILEDKPTVVPIEEGHLAFTCRAHQVMENLILHWMFLPESSESWKQNHTQIQTYHWCIAFYQCTVVMQCD